MALFGRKAKTSPAVVDLRDPAPAPAPRFEFGFPTLCPECGAPGYLDSIDVVECVMYQHCPTCWNQWSTTEAELANQS
jgi:hypothetical protein